MFLVHDIDQMLQFAKSPPETIFATGHAHKGLWALNYDKRLESQTKIY